MDLIEAGKLEVECPLSICRLLQYFGLPFSHIFGISGACLLPGAFFLMLPLKFPPGDLHSLHLLAAVSQVLLVCSQSVLGVHVEGNKLFL